MHAANNSPQAFAHSTIPVAGSLNAAIRAARTGISNSIPIIEDQTVEKSVSGREDKAGPHARTIDINGASRRRRSTLPTFRQSMLVEDRPAPSAVSAHTSSSRSSISFSTPPWASSSSTMDDLVKKDSGLRATIRRLLGSRRLKDPTSTTVASSGPSKYPARTLPAHASRPLHELRANTADSIRSQALTSHAPRAALPDQVRTYNTQPFHLQNKSYASNRRSSLPSAALPPLELKGPTFMAGPDSSDFGSEAASHQISEIAPKVQRSAKRRSRSADALRDLVQSETSSKAQERRLSGEIQYWRRSVLWDPIPALPINHINADHRTKPSQASPSSSAEQAAPPQLSTSRPILGHTQVSSSGIIGDDDASLEQRIATVELKLVDLESAIVNLQRGGGPGSAAAPIRTTALRRPARPILMAGNQSGPIPQSGFESDSTSSSRSNSYHERDDTYRKGGTTSTTTTFRPEILKPSSAPLDGSPCSLTEFRRLIRLLDQEREARHAMNNRLEALQQQFHHLEASTSSATALTKFDLPRSTAGQPSKSPSPSPSSSRHHTACLPFRSRNTNLSAPQVAHLHYNGGSHGLTNGIEYMKHATGNKENGMPMTKEATSSTSLGTDTDEDGRFDMYATPTESRDFGLGLSAAASPGLMVGAV